MPEPWFDPSIMSWLPGAILAGLSGIYATLIGTLAPTGKAKGIVFGMHYFLILLSALMILAGGAGYLLKQPGSICLGFLMAGVICMAVLLGVQKLIGRIYEEAALRNADKK